MRMRNQTLDEGKWDEHGIWNNTSQRLDTKTEKVVEKGDEEINSRKRNAVED